VGIKVEYYHHDSWKRNGRQYPSTLDYTECSEAVDREVLQ
jgi:hypothetical protein